MQIEQRFIENKYQDYQAEIHDIEGFKDETLEIFFTDLSQYNLVVNPKIPLKICSVKSENTEDFKIFDGAGGNLCVYLRLYQLFKFINDSDSRKIQIQKYLKDISPEQSAQDYLQKAEECFLVLKQLIQKQKEEKQNLPHISFFMGATGIFTLGCQLYFYLHDSKKFYECLQQVLETKKEILANISVQCYEVLYGASGYLYCLLDLQKRFQFVDSIDPEFQINLDSHVIEIVDLIIKAGTQKMNKQMLASQLQSQNFRLYYTFYKTEYLGAAHGLFGIIYLLLKAYELNQDSFKKYSLDIGVDLFLQSIKQSLKYCLQHQFNTGNFKAQPSNEVDYLVQFCHGSPGAIQPLLLAHKIFNKFDTNFADQLLKSAIDSGNNIWKFGILKKGFCICHGIYGNAYAFLTLYKETKDTKWLYRALVFALLKKDKEILQIVQTYDFFDRKVVGISDNPYSLMLGLGGNLCFLSDIIQQQNPCFPGYEI